MDACQFNPFRLNEPGQLTFDDSNNIYIADSMNNRILMSPNCSIQQSNVNASIVFSNSLYLPQGLSYHNGSLFVTSPGSFFWNDALFNYDFPPYPSPCNVLEVKYNSYTVLAGYGLSTSTSIGSSCFFPSNRTNPLNGYIVNAPNDLHITAGQQVTSSDSLKLVLGQPYGIVFDPLDGTIFFAEVRNNILRSYNQTSNNVKVFCGIAGTRGVPGIPGPCTTLANKGGQFLKPLNMVISMPLRVLYISDWTGVRVIPLLIKDTNGYNTLLSPYKSCSLSSLLPSLSVNVLSRYEMSLALDSLTGDIFLGVNQKVLQFPPYSSTSPKLFLYKIIFSSTSASFSEVSGLGFDNSGKLYIVDRLASKVYISTRSSARRSLFLVTPLNPLQFYRPASLTPSVFPAFDVSLYELLCLVLYFIILYAVKKRFMSPFSDVTLLLPAPSPPLTP